MVKYPWQKPNPNRKEKTVRYAIISDIHGNLEALQSVLVHIKKRGIKEIICLGDIVGYGPNPIECTNIIMDTAQITLKGNHDEAVIEGPCLFNPIAKRAIEWTICTIQGTQNPRKQEIIDYLTNLPLSYDIDNHYMFVHGSPLNPTLDYLLARDVEYEDELYDDIFNSFSNILFVGHTHMPCIITEAREIYFLHEIEYKYAYENEKIIVNVGSVGQPRDKDPRACYVEVIDDMLFFHRVTYNVDKVFQQIQDIPELDDNLGKRLILGA